MAARRRKILEAAVMCFLENGFHQTGVRDIAKRAGVSLGNLYNHFPGKHDVLVEIASLEQADLRPILTVLQARGSAPRVLDKFLSKYARYMAAPENVLLSIEITSEAIRKDDIGQLFLDNRGLLVDALTLLLQRGIETGDFRSTLAPEQTAQILLDLVDGAAFRSVLGQIPMRRLLPHVRAFITTAVTPSTSGNRG